MNKLRQLWGNLQSSFYFLPSLMVLGSIALAAVLIAADSAGSDQWLAEWPRLFGAGPEGARQILSTLAGSMMSVIGITFSMTLLALTLASTQYTSRILRDLMHSRITQLTLGTFAGIFAFCLVVLRTVRSGEAVFVPGLAVLVAFFLALAGVGVLIFFIHHVASSIQASSIIASISHSTIAAIDRLFPEKMAHESGKDAGREHVLHASENRTWYPVPAEVSGYIQSVDIDRLLRQARDGRCIVRMEHGTGAFVVQDASLVSVAQPSAPDQDTIAALNGAYNISRHRTVEQDPAFGIRQIVDIALKALSPGVNDISTAVMCVDYLTTILTRLTVRQLPPSCRYEGEALRVITIAPTFEGLLAQAFDQIRSSAEGNVAIILRMLGALDTITSLTVSPCRKRALDEQVQLIAELADRTLEARHDRARIERRLLHVRETLAAETASLPGGEA
jgi:uncharacterized membrane protein